MRKENIIKNKKSKQYVMGVIIMLMMLIVSISSVITIHNNNIVKAEENLEFFTQYETQAYSDYTYYRLVTIDNTQVNQTLGGFPVCLNITANEFRSVYNGGHLEDNAEDIEFWDSTNSTEFPYEIELYDNSTGQLIIWVNVSSVSGSADTNFYMYYGDTGASSQEDIAGTWNKNYFVSVYHFSEGTGTNVEDSCWNYNGTLNTSVNWAIGKLGYCYDFNGTGDHVDLGDWSSETFTTLSLETYFNADATDASRWTVKLIELDDDKDMAGQYFYINTLGGYWRTDGSTVENSIALTDTTYWHGFTTTRSGTTAKGYLNGSYDSNFDCTVGAGTFQDMSKAYLGCGYNIGPAAENDFFDGMVDEVRISKVEHNSSWISTTYNSIYNSTSGGFFTLGAEQEQSGTVSTYSLKGLPSPYGITWAGTAGTTVWCNATGTHSETMEINMSINSTDNITEIRVNVGNLNDSGTWINASNISIIVSRDNTSWAGGDGSVNYTAFTDGGSNVSINTSQWTDANGMYGTNPFLGAGLKDTNTSIYCRFVLTIPADAGTDVYSSASLTDWKVYLGHYT